MPKKCRKCGGVRDEVLLGVLPCEFCGDSPKNVETVDLPVDDSWSGQLGHDAYHEPDPSEDDEWSH